jgi:hypothetical protein
MSNDPHRDLQDPITGNDGGRFTTMLLVAAALVAVGLIAFSSFNRSPTADALAPPAVKIDKQLPADAQQPIDRAKGEVEKAPAPVDQPATTP